ncbi:TRAP transporter small permease subunit [Candidatus Spongiihabitans sp.]|uniref:TRAP transporter small permease subunit n=1 Tax=Candidatus Spongiihabitans sp. TaxID=3101308 RepID=UPI003C6F5EAB
MKGLSVLTSFIIWDLVLRTLAALMVVSLLLYLLDNTLIFWFDWPGIRKMITHFGGLINAGNAGQSFKSLSTAEVVRGWIQLLAFLGSFVVIFVLVARTYSRQLRQDAKLYSRIAAFIVRAAFWSVFLVGLTDMVISFLRVEEFLTIFVGRHFTTQLGISTFRGTYIHFPLILLSIVIASFTRTLGFIWLALLIVAAEFVIVITRFIFSYEQAFMGDLVRFWYAGLFLFASAYTLLHDGHVRVDVLYTNFSEKGKALSNTFGSLLFGLPLCWNILIQGMSGKGSIINSPLLNFEISQSGFGMYTKYLMASYLLVFSASMIVQFVSFILSNVANYRGDTDPVNQALSGELSESD